MLEEPGLDLDVRHKGLSAEEWAILSGNPALATLIASEVSWRDVMRAIAWWRHHWRDHPCNEFYASICAFCLKVIAGGSPVVRLLFLRFPHPHLDLRALCLAHRSPRELDGPDRGLPGCKPLYVRVPESR